MGMFDYVRFEDASMLPEPDGFDLNLASLDFQTKSLEKLLYVYRIGKDKCLYREDHFREDSKKEHEKELVNFHGIINFGAYEVTDLIDHHLEYEAKFADGILQDIRLIMYKAYSHESNSLKQKILKEQKIKHDNKILKKILNKFFCFNVFGFEPISLGVFAKEKCLIYFYFPDLFFGHKKEFMSDYYGFYLKNFNNELYYKKGLESKEFSFKVLGIGLKLVVFRSEQV